MANEQNLITPTPSEARKNGKKGGVASGKARRERKALRETLETLLEMPLEDGKSADIDKIKSIAGVKGKNITMQEAIMMSMLNKAAKGDVRAAEYVRDTIGQKAPERMQTEILMSGKLKEVESYVKDKWSDE